MIIVPPVATAMTNRASRNPPNQGEKADSAPAIACSPIATTSGNLRPNLQTDTSSTGYSRFGKPINHIKFIQFSVYDSKCSYISKAHVMKE
jgi:hypothetical protein